MVNGWASLNCTFFRILAHCVYHFIMINIIADFSKKSRELFGFLDNWIWIRFIISQSSNQDFISHSAAPAASTRFEFSFCHVPT